MKKNYYEVLNLAKDCSAKEIKDSFIKLSKKYHPDVNCSNDAQKKFVEINEAYSILGKSDKRKCYDYMLSQNHFYRNDDFINSYDKRKDRYNTYHEFYQRQNMNSNNDFTNFPKNAKRNICTVFFCFFLISLGTMIQVHSMRKKVQYRSYLASLHLKEARERGENLRKRNILANEVLKNNKTAPGEDI